MFLQSFYNIVSKLFSLIIFLPATILLARMLPQEDFGIYHQIILIVTLVSGFFRFSFDDSTLYFCNKYKSDKEKYLLQSYNFLFTISLLFFIVTFILNQSGYITFGDELKAHSIYIIIYISILIPQGLTNKIYIIEKKTNILAIHSFIYFSLKTFLVILVLFNENNISSILYACIMISALNLIFLTFYISYNYGIVLKFLDFKIIKKMLTYSSWLMIGWLTDQFEKYGDKFLLLFLFSVSDFALYQIGSIKIPILFLFTSSISEIILNEISSITEKNAKSIKKIFNYYSIQLKVNILFTIPIIFISYYSISDAIEIIFGKRYLNGVVFFYILNIGTIIQMFSFDYLLRGLGKAKSIGITKLGQFSVMIVLAFMFKEHGIIGVCFAQLFSSIIFSILKIFIINNHTKSSLIKIMPWRIFFISTAYSSIALISIDILGNYVFIMTTELLMLMKIILYTSMIYGLYNKSGFLKISTFYKTNNAVD